MIFGPDPSSHSRCTIGGNIGNNSCGIHSVQSQLYGPGPRTSDNVEALEIVTYDGERFWVGVSEEDQLDEIIAGGGRKGEIYARLRDLRDRYADADPGALPPVDEVPRRVSGYNLDELLPEQRLQRGACAGRHRKHVRHRAPGQAQADPALLKRTLVVVEYDELPDAAEHCMEIIERWKPIGLEALDHRLIEDQRARASTSTDLEELPRRDAPRSAWLLVQFGADAPRNPRTTRAALPRLADRREGLRPRPDRIQLSHAGGQARGDLWRSARAGSEPRRSRPTGRITGRAGRTRRCRRRGSPTTCATCRRCTTSTATAEPCTATSARAASIRGSTSTCARRRASRTFRRFMEEAADLCASYGGSISGEHGDGQARAELLVKQYGEELVDAMREFKLIWDPDWKMNPGKVVDPYRMDEHLKLGTDYNPPRPPVRFAYKLDRGDFAHAALRCVGVGKCRVPHASTVMCPSYMVTREEKHSTRGRARLLFEMLQGEVIRDGWQSKEVYDALDLCLACKGCTSDCPVQVDMPTYKAEFLHHHFKSIRRWRPRYAYSFGLIDQASRIASRMPELVNFVTHAPGLAQAAKLAAGIAPAREIPRFAPLTLQQWWRKRGGTSNPGGPRVVLWPDTFNNHLRTDVGVACVEAIEAAGWQVVIPSGHVCCGRPLYDYGFLDLAERYLRRTLDVLRAEIREGTPVVGMEPSCLAVFKDELTGMLPHDDDAARLARNAMHFAEFFERHEIPVPRLERRAVVWGHCHHKATGGMDPEHALLRRMGVDIQPVSGGCCGLAGSWGFEQGHHEISMQCGEQALLPAVRHADSDSLIIADGFSCKTQIAQSGVGRRALHVGQAMKMAREHGPQGVRGTLPESPYCEARPQPTALRRGARVTMPAALAAAAGVLGLGLSARR